MDSLWITLSLVGGIAAACAILWSLSRIRRRLQGVRVTVEAAPRNRGAWALAGGVLVLGSIAVVVVVYQYFADANLPTFAYALPALPLVLPAWYCFQRAGWAANPPNT